MAYVIMCCTLNDDQSASLRPVVEVDTEGEVRKALVLLDAIFGTDQCWYEGHLIEYEVDDYSPVTLPAEVAQGWIEAKKAHHINIW
jgi:hypothetical protein